VIIACALVGLVFLQVSLLKLNSGIGRAVQSAATLERQNATLRAEVSRLDSGERIQGVADRLGLVMPAAGDRHYLQAGGTAYAAQAARGLTTPAPVVQQPLAPDPTVPAPQVADATQAPATTAPAATHAPVAATGAQAQAPVTTATPDPVTPPADQTAPVTPTAAPTGTTAGGTAAPPATG
jgi:cell division protein FtsL